MKINIRALKSKAGPINESAASGFLAPNSLHWLVLVVLLIATALYWNYAQQQSKKASQEYFDFRVRQSVSLTEQRILAQEQVLRGARGLFAASEKVERDEFRRYVTSLRLEENYSGIQGVGFSQIVPASEKTEHIAKVRKDSGHPEYTIRPEGIRDFYTTIIYLEPFYGRNLRAFGYDMYSEAVRRTALDKARDSGLASMTGKVKLLQEDDKNVQAGFLMYLPVYKNGAPQATVTERRENIIGWVYLPLRMTDLAHGIYGERAGDLDVEIYDGDKESPDALMYDSISNHDLHKQNLVHTQQLSLTDHVWTMVIRSTPLMESRINTNRAALVAFSGVALSFLIAALVWLLANGRSRAIEYAKKMNLDLHNENEKTLALLRNASDGIHILDIHGNIVEFSDAFCNMLGYEREELMGMNLHQWDAGFQEPELTSIFKQQFNNTVRSQFETRHRRKDGSVFDVEISGIPLVLGGETLLFNSSRDISERKEHERKLKQLALEQQTMLDNELVGIIKVKDRQIVWRNKAIDRIFGYDSDELLGASTRILYPDPVAFQALGDAAYPVLQDNGVYRTQLEMVRKNGEKIWIDLSGVLLSAVGTESMWMMADITPIKRHDEEVTKIAYHDILTNLPNRLLLEDRLKQSLAHAERSNRMLAVCYLDLDGFKPVNDNYGHEAGDKVLIEIANRMQAAVRVNDTVARLGGDEFVLLLADLESAEEYKLAIARVAEAIIQPIVLDETNQVKVGASIGITLFPADSNDPDTLLRHADQAMYQAKQSGRNRVCMFTPELPEGQTT